MSGAREGGSRVYWRGGLPVKSSVQLWTESPALVQEADTHLLLNVDLLQHLDELAK